MSAPEQSPRRAPRRKGVATDPTSPHPTLRGRAYPVRFGAVWATALHTVESFSGWTLVSTDGKTGEIRATVTGRFWKRPEEISVLVSLDEHGLTRIDLAATPLTRRLGRRVTLRRMARFLRVLDASI